MIRLSSIAMRFGPEKYKQWVKKHIVYADLSWSFEKFIAISYLYSLAFEIGAVLIFTVYMKMDFLTSFALSQMVFLVVFGIFHLLVSLLADSRAKAAEEVLPDVLKLMALNLKSGVSVERALLLSARPEFGIMEKQIKAMSQKVISGIPIDVALEGIGEKIKSNLLFKTIGLIKEGLEKGGELAILMEEISNDIIHTKSLQKEIAAQVGMYGMFIFFAVGLGAPMLYGVSTFLVKTMMKITGGLNVEDVPQTSGVKFQPIDIDLNFLVTYELIALTVTAIFGSLLLGLIKEGKEMAGVRYIPVLITLNIIVYFAASIVLGRVLTV